MTAITTTTTIWVLGPQDPIMDILEDLLRVLGQKVVYAVGPGGSRLLRTPFPQEGVGVDPTPDLAEGDNVTLVGCEGVRLRDALGLTKDEVVRGHPGRKFRIFHKTSDAVRSALQSAGIGIGGDSKVGWYASIPVGLPDRVHQAVDPEQIGPILYPDD